MQLKFMKKRRCFGLILAAWLGGGVMLSGCASALAGERFGIGIASRINNPPLEEAVLASDTKTIRVEGTGSHVDYGASNGMPVPNEVEFIWRAVGEKETHLEKIKLRSQIPREVLNKISGIRPMYSLSLEFFVLNNVPKVRWYVTEFYIDRSRPKEVERGGDW